ncbi:MAG: hypothetical protein WCD52_06735, partial [Xanthobacteraceae bacterium]
MKQTQTFGVVALHVAPACRTPAITEYHRRNAVSRHVGGRELADSLGLWGQWRAYQKAALMFAQEF